MLKTKIVAGLLALSFCLPVFAAYDGTQQVKAVINGKKKNYKVPVDSSVYQTLFNLPSYTCGELGYTTEADQSACYNFMFLDRADQKEALKPLVNWLNKKIKKSGDRVRAAASLVQNIPYDDNKATGEEEVATGRGHGTRYPYETLYENSGICGEKSFLIAYLLKELGYGTATMVFLSPLHRVAAVKCADAYDFRDTGYCIIQPNYRKMITWEGSQEDEDPYQITVLSGGKTFGAKSDYKDSREYWKIMNSIDAGTYTAKQAKAYRKLIKKYGL
ncbi:MAG: transglutaminase-like domain-containing protein [Parcubacteria group bacterium]|jgi:hypothetical protein